MPTLAVACFPAKTATWPRERGHGTRYTYDETALEMRSGGRLRLPFPAADAIIGVRPPQTAARRLRKLMPWEKNIRV